MDPDPIDEAKALLADLIAPTHWKDSGHVSMLLRPKSAAIVERLIRFHEGYASRTIAEMTLISSTAALLLVEIAKLRDARRMRGSRTMADEFIDGTAPRIWELADKLKDLLER